MTTLHYVEPGTIFGGAAVALVCRRCGLGTIYTHSAGGDEWTS